MMRRSNVPKIARIHNHLHMLIAHGNLSELSDRVINRVIVDDDVFVVVLRHLCKDLAHLVRQRSNIAFLVVAGTYDTDQLSTFRHSAPPRAARYHAAVRRIPSSNSTISRSPSKSSARFTHGTYL